MIHLAGLRPLACVFLLGCAPAMAADLPALVSAQASADGMSYRLIDLDPDDGIEPYWIFVQPYARTFSSYGEGNRSFNNDVEGTFFEAPSFTLQNAAGTVGISRTSSSMAGHSAVEVADLPKLSGTGVLPLNAPEGTTVYGTRSSMSNDFSATSESFKERAWVLSPRTAVVFEGAVHLNAATDLAGLTDAQHAGQVDGSVNASIRLQLNPAYWFEGIPAMAFGLEGDDVLSAKQILQDPTLDWFAGNLGSCCIHSGASGQLPSGASLNESFSAKQRWTDGQLDKPGSQLRLDKPFSVRIDNTDERELGGSMLASLWTSSFLMATPTAAVPEPGTALFMGLGLAALLGWGVRQRGA